MIFQYEEVDKVFEDQKCGDEGGRKKEKKNKKSQWEVEKMPRCDKEI